jgi:protein tyrosine/serine phosphatase
MLSLSRTYLASLLGLFFCALVISGCETASRGAPSPEGLPNFGRVNSGLLRGAQPNEAGIVHLGQLGVRTIINLRQLSDSWPGEEAIARAHGIHCVTVPLKGLEAPTDAQVAEVLALIETSPPPVFIHCEHGADRTGTIVACYRMQHDGWTVERAFAEAKYYRFSPFQIGMRHYIYAFRPQHGQAQVEGPPIH